MNYGRIYAKKVNYNGYVFDSEMEFKRYLYLNELNDTGKIANLKVHPVYELVPKFTNYDGKEIKALNYEGDFEYLDCETSKIVVEDVKGFELPEFKIHRKLFDYHYRYSRSLVVLKYSKTTGFVPIEEYKKAMKTKRQQLIEEKNHYKNIVLKQQHDAEMVEKKKTRELARLKELKELSKLSSQQRKRLEELQEKYPND